MTPDTVLRLKPRYADLKVAVVGEFCLDRYLEIDPTLYETSIETGREVHNVVNVRAQPGAAGTIVNNLVALGVGKILVIGVIGEDGEGFELRSALRRLPGVDDGGLVTSDRWRTFTYCKPMLLSQTGPAMELNRLDSKNWSPLPAEVEVSLVRIVERVEADAIMVMDQVDGAQQGVVTTAVKVALASRGKSIPVIADSRRGLADFPPLVFKMNAAELGRLTSTDTSVEVAQAAVALAKKNGQPVIVTLSEHGILAAEPNGAVHRAPAWPLRGEIDIVGAGDCVAANLTAALASGVPLADALPIAMAAASIVIHQLGTTGTASLDQIASLLTAKQ
jgi:rfaE bifunctional protein kinase chain/domain